MRDVKELPYAGWLEESITLLAGQDVHSIGLAARAARSGALSRG